MHGGEAGRVVWRGLLGLDVLRGLGGAVGACGGAGLKDGAGAAGRRCLVCGGEVVERLSFFVL